MTEHETGGPAFPCPQDSINQNMPSLGMALRDYFAAKALTGMLADLPNSMYGLNWQDNVATAAYKLADAMLEARNK